MQILHEFRNFAVKGNVVDLAVGVIIGGAFGKIVDSLVKDLILPVVGRVVGGLDFSNYFVLLGKPPPDYHGPMTYDALSKAGVPLFAYGNFVTVALNFVILAFVVFLLVRGFNRAKARLHLNLDPAAPLVAPPPTEVYLKEIRDALTTGTVTVARPPQAGHQPQAS